MVGGDVAPQGPSRLVQTDHPKIALTANKSSLGREKNGSGNKLNRKGEIAVSKKMSSTTIISQAEGNDSKALAVHKKDGETHLVGIGNLRVIVCKDGDVWFAQGLEIDYAANGRTLKEVKHNFEEGLAKTIDLHVKVHDKLDQFLNAAPPPVWKELWQLDKKRLYEYSQVSQHASLLKALHLDGVTYIQPSPDEVTA
jgi:hypothetical protein